MLAVLGRRGVPPPSLSRRARQPPGPRASASSSSGSPPARAGFRPSRAQSAPRRSASVSSTRTSPRSRARLQRIQADLDAKRAELSKIRSELSAAKIRLAKLEAYEAHAQQVLSEQLVATYESDRPNLVTRGPQRHGLPGPVEQAVVHAAGQQAGPQRRWPGPRGPPRRGGRSHCARKARATPAGPRRRRPRTTERPRADEREPPAAAPGGGPVPQRQGERARRRARRGRPPAAPAVAAPGSAGRACQTRGRSAVVRLVGLVGLRAGAPAGSGPVSSGGFTFPLPKSAASPPSTWSPDQGVDISAPGNTPEYAVCSGTIVLHGIGGFGPWAPVLHCDSPIDGYSYVYYGHAGPLYQLPVGTHVGAGQVDELDRPRNRRNLDRPAPRDRLLRRKRLARSDPRPPARCCRSCRPPTEASSTSPAYAVPLASQRPLSSAGRALPW